MKRIDTANRVPNMFGTGKDGFKDAFASLNVRGTVADATFFNAVQEEISRVIEATGVNLDPQNNAQLLLAIQTLINEIYTHDVNGDLINLISPTGTTALNLQKSSLTPYECAFWGDSRYNSFSGTTPECSGTGTSFANNRSSMWTVAHMQDAEYSRSYAVDGDTAALWASTSRTNGKTYLDLIKSDVQVVFIQYGVNDCIALTPAATTVANLQHLILEIFKAGKYVVFESINPVNAPVASHAAVQALIDSVNSSIESWLLNFKAQSLYVDTTILLKDVNGFANLGLGFYAADSINPSKLGAYYIGKSIASSVRALLPKKIGFFGSGFSTQNYVNLTSPSPITSHFYTSEVGTVNATQTQGFDANGYFYECLLVPMSLGGTAGDMWRATLQLSANFQTASPPYTALDGNEVLQGVAKVVVDDGANGAPFIYNVSVKQQFFTGSIVSNWSAPTTTSLNEANFTEKVDIRSVTPKLSNITASTVADPAQGAGLACIVSIEGRTPGITIRLRVYNPQVHRVKYITTPLTAAGFALPSSGVAYTNNSFCDQQVTVGGGTVSAISIGGASTGLTSGTFVLSPSDTITVTYTVAPTWTVKQIFNESNEVI
jgi:hypothetical protein